MLLVVEKAQAPLVREAKRKIMGVEQPILQSLKENRPKETDLRFASFLRWEGGTPPPHNFIYQQLKHREENLLQLPPKKSSVSIPLSGGV